MKRNIKEITEQLNKAQEIIDRLGGWFHADIYLYDSIDKQLELRINFWGLPPKQALEAKRLLGFKNMKKEYNQGDEDWKAENIVFNEVRECKITGYRTKHVEAHDEQIPIYDCNGERKNE